MIKKGDIVRLLRENSTRITLAPNVGRSKAWEKFQLIQVDGEIQPFVACKHCQTVYMYNKRDGTSVLTSHLCKTKKKLQRQPRKSVVMVKKDEIGELLQENSTRITLVPNVGRSKAWEKFQLIQVDGEIQPFAACKHCQTVYTYKNRDGTSILTSHSCKAKKERQRQPRKSVVMVKKDEIVELLQEKSTRITLVLKGGGGSLSKVWEKFRLIQLDGDIQPFVACKDCQAVYIHKKRDHTSLLMQHLCGPQVSSVDVTRATDANRGSGANMAMEKGDIVELLREHSARIALVPNDDQRNRSKAWEKFDLVEVDGDIQPFAVCKDCHMVYIYIKRNGTTGLLMHSCQPLNKLEARPQPSRLSVDVAKATDDSGGSKEKDNMAKKDEMGEVLQENTDRIDVVQNDDQQKPASTQLIEAKRKVTAMAALCAAGYLRPYTFLEIPGMRDFAQTLIDIGAEAAERGQRIKAEDVLPSADTIRSENTKVIFDPSEVRRPVSELPPAKRQKKSADAPSPVAVAPAPAAQGKTTRAAAATPTAAGAATVPAGKRTCQFCRRPGRQEVVLVCRMCKTPAHPSCLGYSKRLARKVQGKPWTCLDCKTCVVCRDGGLLIFCDQCDQAYHMSCHRPAVRREPSGEWLCSGCRRDTPSTGAPRRGRPPKLAWKPESPADAKPAVTTAKPHCAAKSRTFKRHGNAKPTATARPAVRTCSKAVPLRCRSPQPAWVSAAAQGGFRGRPVGLVRPSMAAISNLASS